jgi:hypothetical protein
MYVAALGVALFVLAVLILGAVVTDPISSTDRRRNMSGK